MPRGHVDKERARFSRWLKDAGIRFVVTNRLSELNGAPSHFVVDRPPLYPDALGVVVLFKNPAGPTSPRKSQYDWLEAMTQQGWKTVIAFSLEEAIVDLSTFGYRNGVG